MKIGKDTSDPFILTDIKNPTMKTIIKLTLENIVGK